MPLRGLWEDRGERVPCHPCRGVSLLGAGLGRGGDSPWHFLHMCHEIFHVFIIPAVGVGTEKHHRKCCCGIFRAGNLSRCGDVGHWRVVLGSSNPQALAEQPPSLGPTGNKVPVKEHHSDFPVINATPRVCVCLTCPAAFLLSSLFPISLGGRSGCPLGVIALSLQHSSPCPPDRVFRD